MSSLVVVQHELEMIVVQNIDEDKRQIFNSFHVKAFPEFAGSI